MTIETTQIPRGMLTEKPAKIVGLISDTHVPVRARAIPKKVFAIFQKADFIVHAGDLVELAVIDELEQLAPVLAVHGNMDGPEVSGALPKLNSLKVSDWKIGVMHDPNTLFGMGKMREIAKQNGFNAFVYGHTHNSSIKWEGKTLYINPGSATNPISFIGKPSVAFLRITKDAIMPEIVNL
ncbi:TPA: metallophosphoesterase family protein [Candidatus Bathyarchaeota archaeon]|nr:metallophosphoesterase family protein [Candidatus Bathyarchaeota archaeon]HIJ08310.1 metallophosphoesterase family protein [Candidatus Bathyarchaeota archaeon]